MDVLFRQYLLGTWVTTAFSFPRWTVSAE